MHKTLIPLIGDREITNASDVTVARLIEILEGFSDGATVTISDGYTGRMMSSFALAQIPGEHETDGQDTVMLIMHDCVFNCPDCLYKHVDCGYCHECGVRWQEANRPA